MIRKPQKLFNKLSSHFVVAILTFATQAARASDFYTGGSDNTLATILSSVTEFFTGTMGASICLLAIVVAGWLWMIRGVIPKNMALSIMGGSFLIFSSSYIFNSVMGLS